MNFIALEKLAKETGVSVDEYIGLLIEVHEQFCKLIMESSFELIERSLHQSCKCDKKFLKGQYRNPFLHQNDCLYRKIFE
jgi:hypothetical protein